MQKLAFKSTRIVFDSPEGLVLGRPGNFTDEGPGMWRLLSTSRCAEWWRYKIPPLLTCAYALLLVRGGGAAGTLTLLFGIAALGCVGWFAYSINDATDVAEDARRGKINYMVDLPQRRRWTLWFMLLLATLALGSATGAGVVGMALLVIECALPVLYSARPIRLKERGVWGAVADANMVYIIPTLWIAVLLSRHGVDTWRTGVVIGSLLVAAVSLGFRGVFLHQREPGVMRDSLRRSYASALSHSEFQRLLLRRLLPMEWIALVTLVVVLIPVAPLLWLTAPAVLLFEWRRIRAGWRIPALRDEAGNEPRYVPLIFNEVQEIVLPAVLALQLAVAAPSSYGLLFVAHLIAFWPIIPGFSRHIQGVFNALSAVVGRSGRRAIRF